MQSLQNPPHIYLSLQTKTNKLMLIQYQSKYMLKHQRISKQTRIKDVFS